jgi:hypothetical protein
MAKEVAGVEQRLLSDGLAVDVGGFKTALDPIGLAAGCAAR